MTFWLHTKIWLVLNSGINDATWHVFAGVVFLYLGAALFRVAPWSWRAWSLPLGLELLNEVNDLWTQAPGESTLGSVSLDVGATLLLPTLIVTFTPILMRRAGGREVAEKAS